MIGGKKSLMGLLMVSLVMIGCQSNTSPEDVSNDDDKINITVSILPQEYFVKKIGGDFLKVNVMVSPGDSPHTYEPKPQQLKALSEANAYIKIGIPFETVWMDKIKSTNSGMSVIDSAKGIEFKNISHHAHHQEENHNHQEDEQNLDPHIWLSPQLVKIQAQNIATGLEEIDPENATYYQSNLKEFLSEIDLLDQEIKANLINVKNRKFIAFHPSWGYFARDYDLEQIPVEVGGQEPSASELGAIIAQAKAENIKVIFTQPEFNSKNAQTIATEIQGQVVFITPLASDWSNNLLKISQTFKQVLNQNEQ